MNDIFIEQLVKRKRNFRDRFTIIMVILMVILIPVTFVVLAVQHYILAYFIYIALFFLFFGVWLIWFVRSHQNIEFEYQMVQDTLVVSKIIAKRKRKEMLRLDVRTIDSLVKSKDFDDRKYNFNKFTVAAESENDEKNFYATYRHPARGLCGLLFCPNEKVLTAMKPYLDKSIVLKIFYGRG